MTDFLMAEIEEKEKKRVEMESENSPLIMVLEGAPQKDLEYAIIGPLKPVTTPSRI